MDLSAQFKEYLLTQKSPASKVTVKNYLSDVNRFVNWYEKRFNISFNSSTVDFQTLENFKLDSLSLYSASSVERNLSSLRKFFAFLISRNYISQNPFEASKNIIRENDIDPWRLHEFKNYLYSERASNLTIKNYIIDIKQFRFWLEKTMKESNNPYTEANSSILGVNNNTINEYKERLLSEIHLSPVSVNRKLSSIRKYTSWASEAGIINLDIQVLNNPKLITPIFIPEVQEINEEIDPDLSKEYSKFPPIRLFQKLGHGSKLILESLLIIPIAAAMSQIEHAIWVATGKPVFKDAKGKSVDALGTSIGQTKNIKNIPKSFYAPTEISTANFPLHKKIIHQIKYSRPNWYKRYHNKSFAPYLNFTILIVTIISFAYILFLNSSGSKNDSVLGTVTTSADRVLAFQGKISDANGKALNSETSLRMAIYSNQKASGSALLWEEVTTASPNNEGVFNVVLGKNTPIPQNIFYENPSLFLGITVESTKELEPRQQVATVDYSSNSYSVQGLTPITSSEETANVILALNSSGNLTIGGAASPTFQATGGTFTLSGKTLFLTTTSQSNGDIVLSPNGSGTIDIQKGIKNTSNNKSLVQGSVLIEDVLLINTETPKQAVLSVNQGSTGDLIIASTSGITKFRLDNGGNLSTNGTINGLSVSSGTITSGTWNGGLISPTYGGTGLNTSSSTGIPFISSGTWSIDSNYLAVNHGGTGIGSYSTGDILYANGGTSLARLSIGGNGQCLMSNGSYPIWSNCTNQTSTSNSKWSEGLGSIFPNNSTEDFLIGGNSTSSAKFAVINVNENATATISGNLIVMPNNGAGGNAGIGTANPEARLQVSGGGLCVGSDLDCNSDNNSEGVIYSSSTSTSVYDVAENYPTKDASLSPGEVVSMDPERGIFVKRNNKAYNSLAIGAISEKPGLLLGGFNGDQFKNEKQVAVALTGRILVKASAENGRINQGDYVTSATSEGRIMKATRPGPVIGQALEDWDESKEAVMVFIKASYYSNEEFAVNTTELSIIPNQNDGFKVVNDDYLINKIGAFSKIIVANAKIGYLELGKLTVKSAEIATAYIENLSVNSLAIATDNFTIAGVSFKDYIYSIVDNRISEEKIALSSPILESDIIKPKTGNKVAVKLPTDDKNSKLEIINASDSTVASIDAEGNASLSGTLTSNGVQTNDASISGTLRASRVIADQLDLSEEALAKLQGISISSTSAVNNNYISNNYYYNSSESATTSNLLADSSTSDIGSITAASATFTNNLSSFGTATFFEATFSERLFVGAQLSIAGRSINVLGANLELQPLRQGGVSIVGGLVEIDTDGNLKVGGNAYFAKDAQIKGRLTAGIIAPISGNDLIFDFKTGENTNSKIEFRSGSGSAVLTFNSEGDVKASGSGTFNKLNLSFIPKAIAVSDTEIIASGSAGTAEIKPYKNELIIRNPLVTKDSLIYITPKTGTPNQSVYLLRQNPENAETNESEGSFTVGLSKAVSKSVPFNWILIN